MITIFPTKNNNNILYDLLQQREITIWITIKGKKYKYSLKLTEALILKRTSYPKCQLFFPILRNMCFNET